MRPSPCSPQLAGAGTDPGSGQSLDHDQPRVRRRDRLRERGRRFGEPRQSQPLPTTAATTCTRTTRAARPWPTPSTWRCCWDKSKRGNLSQLTDVLHCKLQHNFYARNSAPHRKIWQVLPQGVEREGCRRESSPLKRFGHALDRDWRQAGSVRRAELTSTSVITGRLRLPSSSSGQADERTWMADDALLARSALGGLCGCWARGVAVRTPDRRALGSNLHT